MIKRGVDKAKTVNDESLILKMNIRWVIDQ